MLHIKQVFFSELIFKRNGTSKRKPTFDKTLSFHRKSFQRNIIIVIFFKKTLLYSFEI